MSRISLSYCFCIHYVYVIFSMLLFLYCALWAHLRCKRLMTAVSYYIIIINIVDAPSSPSWVLRRPFSCEPLALACAFPNQTKANIKTNYSNRQLTSAPPTPSSSYMHAHLHAHSPICSKQAGHCWKRQE